jgi:hypothetical protein
MPEISVYPALICLINPLDYQLNPFALCAFLACLFISGNSSPVDITFWCCTVLKSVKTSAMQNRLNLVRPTLPAATRLVGNPCLAKRHSLPATFVGI